MPFKKKRIKALFFSFLFIPACSGRLSYYKSLDKMVAQNEYRAAVDLNEQAKHKFYKKKNALLYYLDRGFLLHINGDYKESSLAFEEAKKIATEHFTKSVTAEASTYLISDNMRPYYGEDFERALIHIFSALNYLYLGSNTEALVEARQVDYFLKKLETDYGHKNIYTEDAFARYLMGMIYENTGDINNAYISYYKALETYSIYNKEYGVSVPGELAADAIRTAKRLGFKDEIRIIKDKWPSNTKDDGKSDLTGRELVVIVYNGFSPVKIDNPFEISFGRGWAYVGSLNAEGEDEAEIEKASAIARSIASSEQIRMSFPKYIDREYEVKSIEAVLGNESYEGVLVEDIGSIAKRNLNDRLGRIRVKTIARAAIKFALSRKISNKVEESRGEASGFFIKKLLGLLSTATEQADKRSWRSLPDKIYMIRLPVSKDTETLSIKFFDSRGVLVTDKVYDNIKLQRSGKTFLTVRTAS